MGPWEHPGKPREDGVTPLPSPFPGNLLSGPVQRQGRVRLEIRERFFPQRVLGTAQAPQGMGTAPRLPELQERLDSAARDAQAGAVGGSGQGQGLDWMILVGPFQGYSFQGYSLILWRISADSRGSQSSFEAQGQLQPGHSPGPARSPVCFVRPNTFL